MKYYIISGEASGDLHGSNLVKALKQLDDSANIRAWGGELIQNAGATLVKHYRETSFMGFWEVIKNIRTIKRLFSECQKDILQFEPDVVILIDYPGFNLRMAKWLKEKNVKVIYYISPQLWAWHASRVEQVRKYVDKMLVILPFEKDFYHQHHIEVEYVGHPLLEAVDNFEQDSDFYQKNQLDKRPIIALLPGSRKQEIDYILPELLVCDDFPDYQFVIAGAPSQSKEIYESILRNNSLNNKPKLIFGQTYQLLSYAHSALVGSGTATLETALFEVPQVVCYKGNPISYEIARRVVKIEYISLVNLIAGKRLVEELIQKNCNKKRISTELANILQDKKQLSVKEDYKHLKMMLGQGGASQKSASKILSFLRQTKM